MAIHQFLSKKILTQLWRLAKLSNCGVRTFFILKNPDIREFRRDLDALGLGTPHAGGRPSTPRGAPNYSGGMRAIPVE